MSTLKTNNIQHVDRSDPSIIINTDGSVNIAGTMTYEDVTNVDAVGIITGRNNIDAQKQVHVGTGVSVKAGGLNVTAGITTVQALQATTGYFSGNLSIDDAIVHNGDNSQIRFPANDTIALETSGSEALRVNSEGKLLIGQTSDNDGQVCMAGVLSFIGGGSGTASGANVRPNISRGSDGQLILAAGKDSEGSIRFDVATNASTNAAEAMRVAKTGDVGIGSAIPRNNFKLDVNGDLSLGESGGTDNTYIDQKQNGFLEIINSGRDDHAGGLRINRMNNISGDTTYFRDVNIYDGKGTSIMYVDGSAAKIGINDTSPERTLDVVGSNAMIQIQGSGGNGRQWSLCSTDDTTGSAVDGGPSGTFAIYDDTSGNAVVRVKSDKSTTFTGIVTATQFITPNETGSLALRNRIDNGSMEISQRGGSEITINGSTEQCLCDRWFARGEGGGPSFLYDQASTAPYGFKNSLKFNCASTGSGSSSIFTITQAIEGNMIADFGFGGGNARDIAVSFWVKSSLTGDFGFSLQNSARNYSYNVVYNIASADTWQYVTKLIPAPTSGTWVNDTGVGLRINFDMGCGSNFRGNAGSWLSADTRGPSGAVSPMQTQNSTWYVTGVQVEMGPAATPFEYRGFTEELKRCHRYFHSVGAGFIAGARGASSSMYLYSYTCPVNLRASPTISTNNNIAHGTFSVRRYRDGSAVSDSTTTPSTNSTYFKANNNTIHLQQDNFSATDDRSATIFISGGAITLSSEIS